MSAQTTIRARGYVTRLDGLCGKSSSELERLLGYTPGSLAPGYMLGLLAEPVLPGQFEIRGYTHLTDGKPKGATLNVHQMRDARLSQHPIDRQKLARLKADTSPFMGTGAKQIAKVFPIGTTVGYEVGLGLVQFELTAEKRFDIALFVDRGESFVRLPHGELKTRRH